MVNGSGSFPACSCPSRRCRHPLARRFAVATRCRCCCLPSPYWICAWPWLLANTHSTAQRRAAQHNTAQHSKTNSKSKAMKSNTNTKSKASQRQIKAKAKATAKAKYKAKRHQSEQAKATPTHRSPSHPAALSIHTSPSNSRQLARPTARPPATRLENAHRCPLVHMEPMIHGIHGQSRLLHGQITGFGGPLRKLI